MLLYHSTPVQELSDHPAALKAGVRLLVQREDLNHPFVSGNKWWKLKYNLIEASRQNFNTILTFGGAYSNHIYATAAATRESGFKCIGVIRGEESRQMNATLAFAREQGMELYPVSRADYRQKEDPVFINKLHQLFGEFYLIPEGGSNIQGVKGCSEFALEHLSKVTFDHLFLPVGTGGTLAGIVAGFKGNKMITGIPVVKGGKGLAHDVSRMITDFYGSDPGNWRLLTEYHQGGYAKVTDELLSFIDQMKRFGLPLDHVYTGKLLLAVIREIEMRSFSQGATILVVHTGGLQGAIASPDVLPNRIP
ncbi:MAG TPA: pyridoxal-phosphate dependent enzyme [Chryseosolibacter sp.]